MGRAVKERESHGAESRDYLLIDAIIGHHPDEERRFADAITYTVGGFHTTGNCKSANGAVGLSLTLWTVSAQPAIVSPQMVQLVYRLHCGRFLHNWQL